MASTPRSNTVLKAQLKEFSKKPEAEYAEWYAGLDVVEKPFVDSILEMSKKKGTSGLSRPSQENLNKDKEDERSGMRNVPAEITDTDISAMWNEIDALDVTSMDQEALKIFEYQGFDPKAILLSLMKAKKKNNVADDQFKADILTLCAISIIKGSINNNNIKKISEEGQQEISRLETTYGIKRGSGRKEKPEVVTVSRVGATFPGKIIQLICAEKVQSRIFMGPFLTSALPTFMRHQAFAAVIPRSLKQRTKDFLLSLVTAFSVDQSIQINPNKKSKVDPATIFATQSNFVNVTHNSQYPPESVKIQIFKTLTIVYEDLLPTTKKVVSIIGDLSVPSKENFETDIAMLE